MIRSLELSNFRIFKSYSIQFSEGVNVLIGPNAIGKTSVLEALTLCLNGTSFKASDKNMINVDEQWARLELYSSFEKDPRTVKLIKDPVVTLKKIFNINNSEYRRLPYNKKVNTVVFDPDTLRLVNGSPQRRRDFIDNLASSQNGEYELQLKKYKKALEQRNNLLKNQHTLTTEDTFTWDVILSQTGSYIQQYRKEVIEKINNDISKIYNDISGLNSTVLITCHNEVFNENELFSRLQSNLYNDTLKGSTTSGPHRDIITFTKDDSPTKDNASRGEVRTIVVALVLIEAKLKSEKQTPIILLDDVLGELDSGRRKKLIEGIKGYQVFITTTDADLILRDFSADINFIPIAS